MKRELFITIEGKNEDGDEIKPETFDIAQVQDVLEIACKIIYGDEKRREREIVGLKYEEGSAGFIFILPALLANSINADLSSVVNSGTIDQISKNRAIGIVELQEKAKAYDWDIEISDGQNEKGLTLRINQDTHYKYEEPEWIEVQKIVYGELVDIGGASEANLHVKIFDGKTITVPASKEQTVDINDKVKVYHPIGLLISVMENRKTGELNKHSAKFIDLVSFKKKNDDLLKESMKIAKQVWKDEPNASDWIRKKRNDYE